MATNKPSFYFLFFPFDLFLSFCVIATIAESHANIAAQQHHCRRHHCPSRALAISLSLSRARARAGAQLRGVENVRFLTVAAAHQKGPSRKNIGN
jgi:hypothetical protein